MVSDTLVNYNDFLNYLFDDSNRNREELFGEWYRNFFDIFNQMTHERIAVIDELSNASEPNLRRMAAQMQDFHAEIDENGQPDYPKTFKRVFFRSYSRGFEICKTMNTPENFMREFWSGWWFQH